MAKVIAAGVLSVGMVFGVAGAVPARAKSPQAEQDCRTYSGAKVCGKIKLTGEQKQCARQAVQKGMTDRRAEVECSQ